MNSIVRRSPVVSAQGRQGASSSGLLAVRAAIEKGECEGSGSGRPLRYLGLVAICFVLMKPGLVDLEGSLAPHIKLLTGIIFLGLCYAHLARGVVLSPVFAIFVFYRLAFLFPTVYNGGDILNWGYTTVAQVSWFLLIELYACAGREERKRLLRAVADLLLIYLVINYVMIRTDTYWTASVSGQFAQPAYLLGIRTRITDCMFVAMLVALLHDLSTSGRWGWRSALAMVCGIVQIITLHVATAAVGTLVALLFYGAARIWPSERGLFSMRSTVPLGVLVTLLVVVGRVHVHFAAGLSLLFGKSVNLTGRTDLWDGAFPIVGKSPLFGYGINYEFGAFIPGRGGLMWQSHNQYLQLMYDGGMLAVLLFLALLWVSATRVDKSQCDPRAKAGFVAVLAAMSVMSVSEIYTYNMGLFYLIPFFASRVDEFVGGRDGREG